MKRFAAYVIDYLIMTLVLGLINIIFIKNIRDFSLRWTVILMCIYILFWLNDFVLRGSSIGKKLMKMKITIKGDSLFRFATIHSLLKIFFSFIWALSFLLLIVGKGSMPYDKWLYDEIEG